LRSIRPWAAHLVTGLRLATALPLVWALWSGFFGLAAALVLAAIASDIADGRIARQMRAESSLGRWLDHGADIAFLLAGLGALAAMGLVPAFVPLAIAGAFAFYVVDSLRRSDTRTLIGSRLGHLSGIFNYAILVGAVADEAVGRVLPEAVRTLCFASVPLYSAAAVAARVMAGR